MTNGTDPVNIATVIIIVLINFMIVLTCFILIEQETAYLNSCNEDNSVSNTNIDDDSITCSAEQTSGDVDNSTNVVANICGVNLPADSTSAEAVSPPISMPV